MKARVTAVSQLLKGYECPPRISPFKVLTFQKWDQQLFDSLSDWMRKQIESSPEYKQLMAGRPLVEGNKEGQWQKKPEPVKKEDVSNVADLPF
jgi:hypothetical protein